MKKAAFILFATLVITVCAKAQTVITQKGTKLTIDSSKWTLTGNDIYNKNSGFVGIGTGTPGFKTHISLATAGGTGISTGNTTNTGLQIEQTTPNTSILQHLKAYNSNTSLIKEIYLGINPTFNSDTGVFSISRVGFSDFILNMMNGNVGIGNNSPKNKLSVSGSFGANITSTGSNLTLDATNYTAIMTSGTPTFTLPAANASTGRIYNIINRTSAARTLANNGTDEVNDFNAAAITSVAAHSSITLQSDGTAWQQIASGFNSSAFSNNAANTRVELVNNADGTTARTAGTEFVIKDNGNIGIGVTTPTAMLDINSGAASSAEVRFRNLSNSQGRQSTSIDYDKNMSILMVDGNGYVYKASNPLAANAGAISFDGSYTSTATAQNLVQINNGSIIRFEILSGLVFGVSGTGAVIYGSITYSADAGFIVSAYGGDGSGGTANALTLTGTGTQTLTFNFANGADLEFSVAGGFVTYRYTNGSVGQNPAFSVFNSIRSR